MRLGGAGVVLTMPHRRGGGVDGNPSRAVLKGGRRKQFLLPSHHMLGYAYLRTGMPARTVEYQHDLFGWAGPDRAGERVELDREELNTDGRRQMPDRAPRRRVHEADEVAPVGPLLDP